MGDFFSFPFKQQFVNECLHSGIVVRINVPTTTPPKMKRLVLIGKDESDMVFGSCFLNSNINWNVFRTEELLSHQHRLCSDDYNSVIDHDCYVDCSKIQGISQAYLIQELTESPENILGQLAEPDFLSIIEIIKNSPLFSPRELRRYGLT